MQSSFFSSVCLEERQKRIFWLALLCLAVKLCGFRLSFRLQGSSYSLCLQALLIPWLTWSFWSLSLPAAQNNTKIWNSPSCPWWWGVSQAAVEEKQRWEVLWRQNTLNSSPFFAMKQRSLEHHLWDLCRPGYAMWEEALKLLQVKTWEDLERLDEHFLWSWHLFGMPWLPHQCPGSW